jgi:sensor domain CHASE-containing protein
MRRILQSMRLSLTGKRSIHNARLLTYLKSNDKEASEQVFRAINAFYSPYALQSNGASSKEIKEALIDAIGDLESQIIKLRLTFGLNDNPQVAVQPIKDSEGTIPPKIAASQIKSFDEQLSNVMRTKDQFDYDDSDLTFDDDELLEFDYLPSIDAGFRT